MMYDHYWYILRLKFEWINGQRRRRTTTVVTVSQVITQILNCSVNAKQLEFGRIQKVDKTIKNTLIIRHLMHIDRSNGCATENKKENTVYVWWASGAVASIIMALTYTHIYSHKSIDNHSSHEITSMKVVQLPIHLFSALNYVSPFCFIKHTDFLLHFVSSGIFVERRKKHHQTADCDHCIVRRVFLPRLIPIMWSKNKVFRTQYN